MSTGTLAAPRSVDELDDELSRPRDATVAALRAAPGDIVILGAGGKMGPTLARMAVRAAESADASPRRVFAVSRFTSPAAVRELERHGVGIVRADLLDPAALSRLPDAPNVIFMAGQKFGTSDAPSRTWMMNVVVPALCAARYAAAGSRILVFSTGNVYPLVPAGDGGARETTQPQPVGEYAVSCLGRERVFEHYGATRGVPVAIMRLNYAIDLRYGVLTDIARRIVAGEPVPLAMGYVNVIWQGDANRAALELLPHAGVPPLVVNVTGARALAVRDLASALAARLARPVSFAGIEAPDALLSDASRMRDLLGDECLSIETMLDWTAEWVREGRPLLEKPTHFETRDGTF